MVGGILEWDLFKCPNSFKIYPTCKLKEEITNEILEDRKKELQTRKEIIIGVLLPPDLFIQNLETNLDDDDNAIAPENR